MSRRQRRVRLERRQRATVPKARRVAAAAGGLAVAASLLSGSVAEAATTFTVTTNGEDASPAACTADQCATLRDAINAANNVAGASMIVFASNVTGSIDLTSELPSLYKVIDIQGPGASVLTVDQVSPDKGSTDEDILYIPVSGTGAVVVSGLTLTGAQSVDGGAIEAAEGRPLTLDAVTVRGNSAYEGGGIEAEGGLTIEDSTVSGNTATKEAGGIYGFGAVTIEDSTISGNSAPDLGGGIYQGAGVMTVVDSTIAGNHVTGASAHGGGVYIRSGSTSTALEDSIVSGNTAANGPDVYKPSGAPTPTASFSLLGSLSGSGITPDSTDLVGLNPQLGPLQGNGGATETMAPEDTSPVIDRGKAFGEATEQRGLPRPVDLPGYPNASGGDGSDIGAVELQPSEVLPTVSGLSADSGNAGTPVVIKGVHLAPAVSVFFGSARAAFTVQSDGQLTATAPAGTGTVDVRVVSPGGTSPGVATDRFSYPPPVLTTTGRFDNQLLTITTPSTSTCTSPSGKLSVTFSTAKIPHSPKRKLSFVRAAFYIGKGIPHKRKHHKTTYKPNVTLDHATGSMSLHLKGLATGLHTLTVVVSYKAPRTVHGRRRTTTVTKTTRVQFNVC